MVVIIHVMDKSLILFQRHCSFPRKASSSSLTLSSWLMMAAFPSSLPILLSHCFNPQISFFLVLNLINSTLSKLTLVSLVMVILNIGSKSDLAWNNSIWQLMVLAKETELSGKSMSSIGDFYDGWAGVKQFLQGDPAPALVRKEKGHRYSLTAQVCSYTLFPCIDSHHSKTIF